MRRVSSFFLFLTIAILLSSCQFHCSLGKTSENEEPGKQYKPVEKDGALLYNGIRVKTNKVKLDKAYLVNRDSIGGMIEEGNFVDISKGVKLLLLIGDGWKETADGVSLGASMKAVADNNETLLEKDDIFSASGPNSLADSKSLGLSLFFNTWEARRPVTIVVTFKVWDKNSDAYIDGSYTIHTK